MGNHDLVVDSGTVLTIVRGNSTQTGSCDIRTNGGPPLMPNPQVECHNLTRSDVHVPMCDGANRSKCSERFYFGTHQVPMVPGGHFLHFILRFPFDVSGFR